MNEWISVDERLPEEHDSILARFYSDGTQTPGMCRRLSDEVIITGVYDDGSKFVTHSRTHDGEWHVSLVVSMTVTHWMPLPEPPKEGEKNHHLYSNVAPKPGGPYSLYCKSCKCWVPNTANVEMRKEGLYAHSHWCKDGICDMCNGEIKEATP